MAAEYTIKLPEDLKASLISEFEGTWDSEDEHGEAAPVTMSREAHQDSISSQTSEEQGPSKNTIGSRLKKIVSPETKLPKSDSVPDEVKRG